MEEISELAIRRGKKITELRESKGLSIRGLARKIGMSDTALAKIEKGNNDNIKIDTGVRIAKALEVSFVELFEIELPESPIEESLNAQIERLEKMLELKEGIEKLKDQKIALQKENLDSLLIFKEAYVQEVVLGFEMVKTVERKIKEKYGDEYEASFNPEEIKKETIEHLQNEFPSIDLQENYIPISKELLDAIKKRDYIMIKKAED